jgi:hypothetical protein
MMCNEIVGLTTQAKTYATIPEANAHGGAFDQPSSSTPPPLSGHIHMEKHLFDLVLRPPKSTIHKSTFNPSSRNAHNYNIVEYFS